MTVECVFEPVFFLSALIIVISPLSLPLSPFSLEAEFKVQGKTIHSSFQLSIRKY